MIENGESGNHYYIRTKTKKMKNTILIGIILAGALVSCGGSEEVANEEATHEEMTDSISVDTLNNDETIVDSTSVEIMTDTTSVDDTLVTYKENTNKSGDKALAWEYAAYCSHHHQYLSKYHPKRGVAESARKNHLIHYPRHYVRIERR